MFPVRYKKVGLLALLTFALITVAYNFYRKTKHVYRYDYTQPIERENAAFVILARNEDLGTLRETMQMLEDRFNHRFNYPYVFLNNDPFDDRFKEFTSGLASGKTFYGVLSPEMWSYPDWIDQEKALLARQQMEKDQVIYGGSESYRHMCRFQSGFFFRHPLLSQYDYYWRVEPHVEFKCDIDYDPFRVMREKKAKYGFAISLHEYGSTIPTLWETTKGFMKEYPQHIIPANDSESMMGWVSDDGGESYNLCHFWSNFEIADLSWLRSQAYIDYFNYLDKAGGFFYERWGDAPVHSIAAALMLKKSEFHFFYDMGYFHNPFTQCPNEPAWLAAEKCSCNPAQSMEKHYWSCTPQFLDLVNKQSKDFVITQRH
ncbi:nucleotide-diphospho-sugar transferase [Sporodiniella umbellata]|nr:nucleotide-diphospho-sugar transferase [Sporodiniella umbellata]